MSDSLISTNGIISQRLAGKVRFLDHLPEEQERQITMKSSCISLRYQHETLGDHLINLIDSPGHVDFASEVSTAVRVSDGAILVVDVVEGVASQTKEVLRQAWSEKVHPVLVLNKIDRLYSHLGLTPLEAFDRIKKVLEQVNAVVGTLFSIDMIQQLEKAEQLAEEDKEVLEIETSDDEDLYFSPERGNVVFACAADNWGFRYALILIGILTNVTESNNLLTCTPISLESRKRSYRRHCGASGTSTQKQKRSTRKTLLEK